MLAWAAALLLAAVSFVLGLHYERLRERRRRHRAARAAAAGGLQRLLAQQEPDFARQLWGEAPPWFRAHDAQKTLALNTLLASMWPCLASASSRSLVASIGPALRKAAANSALLRDCEISRLDLGLVPPTVTTLHARSRQAGCDEVAISLRVEWGAKADVHLAVTPVGGASPVAVRLADFSFFGTVVLTGAPLVDDWPCIGGLGVFVPREDMTLDFSCNAMGTDMMSLPFLDRWLRETLVSCFAGVHMTFAPDFMKVLWGEKRPVELEERAARQRRGACSAAAEPTLADVQLAAVAAKGASHLGSSGGRAATASPHRKDAQTLRSIATSV